MERRLTIVSGGQGAILKKRAGIRGNGHNLSDECANFRFLLNYLAFYVIIHKYYSHISI